MGVVASGRRYRPSMTDLPADALRVVATIPIDPARAAEAAAALADPRRGDRARRRAATPTTSSSPPTAPGTFVTVEAWRCQADLDAHMGTPHIGKAFEVLGPRDRRATSRSTRSRRSEPDRPGCNATWPRNADTYVTRRLISALARRRTAAVRRRSGRGLPDRSRARPAGRGTGADPGHELAVLAQRRRPPRPRRRALPAHGPGPGQRRGDAPRQDRLPHRPEGHPRRHPVLPLGRHPRQRQARRRRPLPGRRPRDRPRHHPHRHDPVAVRTTPIAAGAGTLKLSSNTVYPYARSSTTSSSATFTSPRGAAGDGPRRRA